MAPRVSLPSHVIFFFSTLHLVARSDAVRVEISPSTFIATMENTVHISCVPDSVDGGLSKEITVMKISRNNDDTVAILRHCNNITYGGNLSTMFQADGHIDRDAQRSYLNVTLVDPKSEDTGIYTCAMYYLDVSGHVKEEKASGTLNAQKLDIRSLERVLNTFKERIRSLEESCENQVQHLLDKDSALMTRMDNLETKEQTQSQSLDALSGQVNNTSAFSAYNSKKFKPLVGSVLILPDLIMKKGEGYDPTTGVFTAPVAGLYTFHMSLRMSCTDCSIKIDLMSNEDVFARLYVGDSTYQDQASVSSLVDLGRGDKVKAVVNYSSGELHFRKYTVLTGYLIHIYL